MHTEPSSSNKKVESSSSNNALLATTVTKVLDSRGKEITCRALLDNGSQMYFMTSELASRLKLKMHDFNVSISGIGQGKVSSTKVVKATIKSRVSKFRDHILHRAPERYRSITTKTNPNKSGQYSPVHKASR